jgi:hypothetical protein
VQYPGPSISALLLQNGLCKPRPAVLVSAVVLLLFSLDYPVLPEESATGTRLVEPVVFFVSILQSLQRQRGEKRFLGAARDGLYSKVQRSIVTGSRTLHGVGWQYYLVTMAMILMVYVVMPC